MKLFKKVVILSLAILSLGSSVAFGCDAAKISATGVAATKSADDQSGADHKDNKETKSGKADNS